MLLIDWPYNWQVLNRLLLDGKRNVLLLGLQQFLGACRDRDGLADGTHFQTRIHLRRLARIHLQIVHRVGLESGGCDGDAIGIRNQMVDPVFAEGICLRT